MKASVTIHGAQVPLYFNVEASVYVAQQPEVQAVKEGDQISVTHAAIILYAGHKGECLASRSLESLQFRDFYEYVNEQTMKNDLVEVTTAVEAYMQSLTYGLPKKEPVANEEKKRLSRKK